ncbi:hypothetical protein HXX76_015411 [Chlamydomonas incerta]|uniref:Uncharacterized protein n=1 Tax=Chlamydomonas incerta TaxID=51695 RepID=A0A835SNR3_CHLIN|nr:hypothetical protein HXX76_015411 [Chlamydomonas incerta]|eukprot:KAG2423261.1 hypothetical protein HXX76_015411 [Chlamydomonas incerta]
MAPAAAATAFSSLATLSTPLTGTSTSQYLNLTTNVTNWKSSTLTSPRATATFVTTTTEPLTAISADSRLNLLQRALINNGLWKGLQDESLNRTVFASADSGITGVNNDFNINVQANSTIATNMLNYMQAYGTQNTNFTADVNANYTYVSLYGNRTVTANQTGANAVAVNSLGSVTKITYGTLQVGGPAPKSLIHIVGYVIETDPNLSVLVGLFLTEGKEYKKLQAIIVGGQTTTSASPYTLVAPNNAALNKFAANYNTAVGNLTSLIGLNNLAAFLRRPADSSIMHHSFAWMAPPQNHIVVGSYRTENLTAGVQLTTLQ